MSNRITIKDLENLCAKVNAAAGAPSQAWVSGKAQIGNYHIYQAYGAFALHRMKSEEGGALTVIGLTTKRDLYRDMWGVLNDVSREAQP